MPVVPFSEQVQTHIDMVRNAAREEFRKAETRFDTTMELCNDMEDRLKKRIEREEKRDAEESAKAAGAGEAFANAAAIAQANGGAAPT
jgi:hypothetical protein